MREFLEVSHYRVCSLFLTLSPEFSLSLHRFHYECSNTNYLRIEFSRCVPLTNHRLAFLLFEFVFRALSRTVKCSFFEARFASSLVSSLSFSAFIPVHVRNMKQEKQVQRLLIEPSFKRGAKYLHRRNRMVSGRK